MIYEGSCKVTNVLSVVVAPEKMDQYEAWLVEGEAILRRQEGFLGMEVIKPKSHIEPEYIILLHFATQEALAAWRGSRDRDEIHRQTAAFVVAPAQEAEKALGFDMMFERPATGHLYPKPAFYKQALVAMITVYPVLLLMRITIQPELHALPLLLALLVSVLIMGPIMTALMPQVSKLFTGWLYPRPK